MDKKSNSTQAEAYAENMAIQLRKGFLVYCVLIICAQEAKYTSDILETLRKTKLVVVEGTIYPLLNRLQKDGLLSHKWQESEQGPPRKYYSLTTYGRQVVEHLKVQSNQLHKALKILEKGVNNEGTN